jgi:hypothetical protein
MLWAEKKRTLAEVGDASDSSGAAGKDAFFYHDRHQESMTIAPCA